MFAAPADWTQLPASLAPTIALLECAWIYRRFRSQISAHRSLWLHHVGCIALGMHQIATA